MIKIREIQEKDNSALAKLIRESLKANQLDIPGTAYFDAELDNLSAYYQSSRQRQYFVVLDENGEVSGGCGIAEYDSDNRVAELQKLYLINTVQGHHLSYKLLTKVIEFANQAGYRQLYLETHHNLASAMHIYQTFGFEELSQPLNNGEHSAMDHFFILKL